MLRFRLRSLLIAITALAVPCAWVGWSLRWIEARRQWTADTPSKWPSFRNKQTAPAGLWLFGEDGRDYVRWFSEMRISKEEMQRLFPEAQIVEWKDE
jgi:hypothetical protein